VALESLQTTLLYLGGESPTPERWTRWARPGVREFVIGCRRVRGFLGSLGSEPRNDQHNGHISFEWQLARFGFLVQRAGVCVLYALPW
jgi:hypothetical protein